MFPAFLRQRPGYPLRTVWQRVLALEATPRAIAGGLAVGMFFGMSPLCGIKTLLTLGCASLLRVNPLAAFLSLSLHDLLVPFLPITLLIQIRSRLLFAEPSTPNAATPSAG